jgi:hypothetical protein
MSRRMVNVAVAEIGLQRTSITPSNAKRTLYAPLPGKKHRM